MTANSNGEGDYEDQRITSGEFVWMKSSLDRQRCDYLISTQKLTVWSRRADGIIKRMFGVFAEVGQAYLYKPAPDFEISWDQVEGITKGRWGLAPKFTIKLKDGREFVFLVNGYGKEQPNFIHGLQSATGINLSA